MLRRAHSQERESGDGHELTVLSGESLTGRARVNGVALANIRSKCLASANSLRGAAAGLELIESTPPDCRFDFPLR